ncbi:benzaldehyde dehydrogenase [Phytohabitans sp. ZYX-F-186]|uniref:Benzaldehyde dehydrogenase n=1 Tax=Phytohabitans maris TaxID=3071409 RepID=A0ABU0ZJS8_9ACTN|nr:benzaldehyde dehydrogenase [Phytohabitans sp. ZYX-F-186]MDQ7907303.1 benzaldehyde dehydrogenase [Phytohabitans sp. ZYX-F-186]
MLLDRPTWQGKFFSSGWVSGEGGDAAVVEPATGAEIGRVGIAGPGDVAAAARAAAAAQASWAAQPHPERAAVLRRAGDLWQANAEEVRDWIVRETGAVPPKGDFEILVATQECYEAAALPSRPYGELLPSLDGRLSMSRRVPAGVVGVISPFNFPLILSIRSVAPALALGNAVLLKPDRRTAVSGGLLLAGIFAQAGLPEGLLHVLPGGPEVGEAVIADPRVRVVSFTGSTRAGRRVGQVAAANLTRAHLELGGNSALVVLDDADLDRAISAGAWGSFNHQGQICMTTGRHLVHESLYDEYVERLAKKADALELGPVIDAGQRDKIHALVTGSVDRGARLAAGGTFSGLFYRPTVLAEVTPEMPAYAEEVFGPVAPVARFGSLEEAAALASGTEYGLSLGIITRDVTKGLALADRIPTGIAHINDQTVNDEANVPFGGVGASGTGARFGGAAANVEAFTETRWVTVRGDVPAYPF